MDLLSTIKNCISDQTVQNISSFVSEDSAKLSNGLNLSINSFLAGLLKYTSSDAETFKIINVLKEGGHTGDLLNNLENFSENNDKTKLLVTIGNNITSHFFGQKTALVDKIAELSAIKKTSAASIFSISAPIVLGYLGKELKNNRLGPTGLRELLSSNSDALINSLPPAIGNILHLKSTNASVIDEVPVEEKIVNDQKEYLEPIVSATKVENAKPKEQSNFNWMPLLAWGLLILGALFSLYYYKFMKNANNEEKTELMMTDSTELSSEDFLPDSSVTLNTDKIVSDTIKNDVPKAVPVDKPEAPTPVKVVVPQPIEKAKVTAVPKPSVKSAPISVKKDFDEIIPKTTLPAGWNSPSQNLYVRNSAEISNTSALNSIAKQLSGSNKKIRIAMVSGANKTLSEDRAYALRELLIQKGVDESQIEISSKIAGNNEAGVAYKIEN